MIGCVRKNRLSLLFSRFESIDAAYTAESVGDGAELDYKFTVYSILGIESNSLIVIDGITYNANEAGNFYGQQ